MSDASRYSEALARNRGKGPLYRQLSGAISELIASGVLPSGASLPPERDLASMTGLSRVTVRRAMQDLAQSGHLIQKQGSGTYVAPQEDRMRQPLHKLTSFSEDMRRRGMTPRSVWLARGLHAPSSEEAMSLGIPVSEDVARLSRIRLADEKPIAIERATLPARILPDPEAVEGSLYEILSARGLCPTRAIQRITAANATPSDAETLGILIGAAVLKVERIAYLPGGRTAEFTRSLYRGDSYDFVAELR